MHILVQVDVALHRKFYSARIVRTGGVCCFARHPLPLYKAPKTAHNHFRNRMRTPKKDGVKVNQFR